MTIRWSLCVTPEIAYLDPVSLAWTRFSLCVWTDPWSACGLWYLSKCMLLVYCTLIVGSPRDSPWPQQAANNQRRPTWACILHTSRRRKPLASAIPISMLCSVICPSNPSLKQNKYIPCHTIPYNKIQYNAAIIVQTFNVRMAVWMASSSSNSSL